MKIELIEQPPIDPDVATITVTAQELRFLRDVVGKTSTRADTVYNISTAAVFRHLNATATSLRISDEYVESTKLGM